MPKFEWFTEEVGDGPYKWTKVGFRLAEHTAQDIMETSDEEIIQETIDDGQDPAEIEAHGRELIERCITKARKDA